MASSDPALLPVIVDRLWRTMPSRILDVGMGFGKLGFLAREYLDVYYHRRYGPSQWTTVIDGIEICPEFITDMHRYLYDHIHVGDAARIVPMLPRYDLVCMFDVIEHIPKPQGLRLIEAMRRHGKRVLISTPATEMPQDAILGNPHERHVSFWTPEEIGGTCTPVGPLILCELDGIEPRDVNFVTEGAPGWALRHLTLDIAEFLRRGGYTVNPLYDWGDDGDIQRVKHLATTDPEFRAYASTGPAAEIIHSGWGVPREKLYFLLHSVDDILELQMRARESRAPNVDERMAYLGSVHSMGRDQELIDLCSRYSGVGYLSLEQERILEAAGVEDAFYTPQYVDPERFVPIEREWPETGGIPPLRVGAALTTISHPARKGLSLLSEIVEAITGRDDMVFDARAIKGPGGAPGLPYDEMPSFLGGLDVLICTAFSEGGPLPPLQAASCAVPTVSTPCGHMPELVEDGTTAFLVEPTLDAFMDKLSCLAYDRGKLREMGLAARERAVTSWSVEAQGGRWIEMLDGLR